MKWLNLVVGGISGTCARYILAGLVYRVLGASFPFGTLIVNLLGCFIIGVLAVLSEERFLLDPNARLLWMAGFCGAFTTFSTFMLETANLLKDGEVLKAGVNVTVSVLGGFVVFRLGVLLARVF